MLLVKTKKENKFEKMVEEATLTSIEQDENGTSIVGIIKKGKHKIRVPAQDIDLKDKKAKYAEWLGAYRHWLG